MHYNRAILTAGILLSAVSIRAQYARDLDQGNSDYAVPVPAALYALVAHSTPILTPSTVRDLAVSVYQQQSSTSGTYIGAEVAPILIGRAIDLSKYLSGRLMRVLLRTRISFAFDVSRNDQTRSSLGLRWMLHDDADLRSDSLFQRTLLRWGTESIYEPQCASIYPKGSDEYVSCLTEKIASDPSYQDRTDSLRRAMNDDLWNRSVFEIAFASAYTSVKSQLEVRRYYGFANIGFPIFGRSDRLDFGASVYTGYDDDSPCYKRQADLTLRMNYGWHNRHFFGGGKLTASNKVSPDHRIELGAAASIGGGFWFRPEINFSLKEHSLHPVIGSLIVSYGSL